MTTWSLSKILSSLHDDIEQQLKTSRQTLGHPVAKGTATEGVWLELFNTYLPKRYSATTAFVVDSNGKFSDQLDVVVFDRQYSPLVFKFKEQTVIPVESVYAVFEAKQAINAQQIEYAAKKVASVRMLHRTSVPIPHAGGTYPAKVPMPIVGGILTFESDWSPAFGDPLLQALQATGQDGHLEIGCAAASGMFAFDASTGYQVTPAGKPATAFLLELIARLQGIATVPMLDVRAYAKWLEP